MAVTVLLDLHTKAGRGDELEEFLAKILPDSRAFDGCIELRVVRNQDDPEHIVVIERWESRAHHEAYFAWRVEEGTLAAALDYLETQPVFRYFDPSDA